MPNYKGLLTTDNVEQGSSSTSASGGLTIPKQLYGSLIESVRRNLVWRPLAAIAIGPGQIPGSSVDVDLESEGNPGLDVLEVAEGAEFPMEALQIETFNVKPKKYGVRLPITEEMLEDGKWNLLQRSVEVAGYKVAKKMDGLIIDSVRANAGFTTSGGATLTIPNITESMQDLEGNGYTPTDFIVGVEVANDLRNIDLFVHADKSGITNVGQALIGRIYGMNVWVSNNLGNGNTGARTDAYVIDRRHAFMYAEKRAVTVKNFDQIYKDVRNAVVSFRFAARYLRANATSKITTT